MQLLLVPQMYKPMAKNNRSWVIYKHNSSQTCVRFKEILKHNTERRMNICSRNVEKDIQDNSENVYVELCRIVGTSIDVRIRRETTDISSRVRNQAIQNIDQVSMVSGSGREGFRFTKSDMDFMVWPNNFRVILDLSQIPCCSTTNKTWILADNSSSPPGFTLLELLTRSNRKVYSTCFRINDRLCISSSKYRRLARQLNFPSSFEHGPCCSFVAGSEIDCAQCFACDFWPTFASSWIKRSHTWPDPEVVDDIVRNGCHFVPIGNQVTYLANEEWRFSSSLAEYKLVKSMNHCQFLVYGLLKLFLKDVIHSQSEQTSKLLCSYHMKTIVFWVIQDNAMSHLCPQNLLAGFWVCFKRLLKWVYEGVCPNFFIPQNNMFLSKIHGSAQSSLFSQLYDLYEKGPACVLQNTSIKLFRTNFLLKTEVDYDLGLTYELVLNRFLISDIRDLNHCLKFLHSIELLLRSTLTQYEVAMLQKHTTTILQTVAFILHDSHASNKMMYKLDKISCHMLKFAAKFGYVSDMVFIAMYYYKTFRYKKALSVLEMTKEKLIQPYLMYMGNVDRKRYTEEVGRQTWSAKITKAVANDIHVWSTIGYITKLTEERLSSAMHSVPSICLPLFVLLPFLEFLCYRPTDFSLAQEALDRLQRIVHKDEENIQEVDRDISWEILGICQQMTENYEAALYSFERSLKQNQTNGIEFATRSRIVFMNRS